MSKSKLYKITNTTEKPVRLNKSGQDIRPLRDRVGHAVQFPNPAKPKESIILYPNRSCVVDSAPEGIFGLFRKGFVGITEMGDISEELKKLTFKPGKNGEKEAVRPAEPEMMKVPEPEPVPEPPKKEEEDKPSKDRMAKASPMGADVKEDKPMNPDGEDNFTVKAPKGGMKRKKASSILGDED